MKKYIAIVAVIVIAAGLFYFWRTRTKKDDKQEAQTEIYTVERGGLMQSVDSTGRVVSNKDVEIKCKASGEVISLPYDESDVVPEGELVLELDPVDEKRNVDKARVSLQAAQSKLERARQSLSIAEDELVTATRQAKVVLTSAQADATDAEDKIRRTQELYDTKRETVRVALETAKVKAKDAEAKKDRVRILYNKSLAGEEELETAMTSATQAAADLEKAGISVRETETSREEALKSARVSKINADTNLEKAKIAIDKLDEQRASLELNRNDVAVAETSVETARLALEDAEQRLSETKISSPINGVITSLAVQTGQIISSGISNVGGGTTVMTISDMRRIFVIASVDESDVGSIEKDQRVSITVDAFPNERFMGRVERVAQQGVNTSNVVTFDVKIEVMSENKKMLKPEMTANVKIITLAMRDVIAIPTYAIERDKDKSTVTVVDSNGKKHKREVTTGVTNGMQIEIKDGLKSGEKLEVKKGVAQSMWSGNGQGGNNDRRRRRRPMGF